MKAIMCTLTVLFLLCTAGCQTIGNARPNDASSRTESITPSPSVASSLPDESVLDAVTVPPAASDEPADAQPTESESAPKTVQVTFPEGSTFMQIARKLEEKGVCTAGAFYKAAQKYQVKSFTVPSGKKRCFKMEGYLFPDTYEFYTGEDPAEVLRRMLNNYAAKSGMPSDKTLILASIIEKEARSDENMALVSSVFHNRLEKKMKLESDATREYINRDVTGNKLVPSPSQYAALYNTYKCAALPAGPICNPSVRAIAAAQNPKKTSYLFFFYGNDNQNHYSESLEEHEAQKKEFGVQFE